MMESGLGAALMGRGLADELKQATFSIGLKGVAKEDVPKVEGFPPRSDQVALARVALREAAAVR